MHILDENINTYNTLILIFLIIWCTHSCHLIDGRYVPTYSGYDVDIRTHFIIIEGENKIRRRYVQRETCTKV